mmetsp:Transcript_23695/g.66453  ORF Transcript_23695/g.66453 Transcript_23695/m.66453 type:complete len:299 (-) Transcript_23695:245-1141(-)
MKKWILVPVVHILSSLVSYSCGADHMSDSHYFHNEISSSLGVEMHTQSCQEAVTMGKMCHTGKYEYHECIAEGESKSLVYVHIFKAGGTSVSSYMHAHCKEVRVYTHWGVHHRHVNSMSVFKNGIFFSFLRAPIDRFLSAYHEVQRINLNNKAKSEKSVRGDRGHHSSSCPYGFAETITGVYKELTGPANRRSAVYDLHYQPQACFLRMPVKPFHPLPMRYLLPHTAISSFMPWLLCSELHLNCNGSVAELANRARSRDDPTYSLPQCLVTERNLTRTLSTMLHDVYSIDQICFPHLE